MTTKRIHPAWRRADGATCSVATRILEAFRSKDGSATVEFVLWFPVFVTMIAVITDLSFIYTTNASMWDAARDTARRMAFRQIDAAEAQTWAKNAVALGKPEDYTVVATEGEDVVVEITTSTSDASVFGIYAALLPGTLTARVTMMREPE